MTRSMLRIMTPAPVLAAALAIAGCAGQQKKPQPFFTSGSPEADQRADQRMAKDRQLKGGNDADDAKTTKASSTAKGDKTDEPARAPAKLTLYERLGGEEAINKIVDDFVTRALADPRVNWERKGVTQGGFSWHRNKSVEWHGNVEVMKKHIAQFLALATGGPSTYGGKEMKQAHAGMHIANPEFDAAVGDLKATLDKVQIPNQEQKELLAIVESTRPQVVEER
jgi:hemoglobin